jgi:hypothetical protein
MFSDAAILVSLGMHLSSVFRLLAAGAAALALAAAAWAMWPVAPVRVLPGADGLFQRGREGACVAVAALAGGVGGRMEIRLEGPLVADGCGGCASGAWPTEGCEVRVRPVAGAPGPFGGTLDVLRDGRSLAFVGLSGHAFGLSPALRWRALPSEDGGSATAFELCNLGDATGPPGYPILLGPESDGLRIAWTDCGLPLEPGAVCVVRIRVLRSGASGLLALPGVVGGIRVGPGDLSEW